MKEFLFFREHKCRIWIYQPRFFGFRSFPLGFLPYFFSILSGLSSLHFLTIVMSFLPPKKAFLGVFDLIMRVLFFFCGHI